MLLRSLFFASFMLISMMGYAQREKHDTSIAISQTHLPQPTRPRKPEHIVIECRSDKYRDRRNVLRNVSFSPRSMQCCNFVRTGYVYNTN